MAKDAVGELVPLALLGVGLWVAWPLLSGGLANLNKVATNIAGTGQGGSSTAAGTTGATTNATGPTQSSGSSPTGAVPQAVIGLQHIFGPGTPAPSSTSYHSSYPQAGYIDATGAAANTGVVYRVYAMNDGSYTLIQAA